MTDGLLLISTLDLPTSDIRQVHYNNMSGILVVSRYLPHMAEVEEELSATDQRNDSLDDFNHPRYRRKKILHELYGRQLDRRCLFQSPPNPSKDLTPYENVQSKDLIHFFGTAWDRWEAMGPDGQDPSSSLPMAGLPGEADTKRPQQHVSLPLIPGNTPLPREPYQRPSRNVMGQIGYFCTDTCTPIFAELEEELLWDVAVMEEALECLFKKSEEAIIYALPTHPGHHAARDSFGGYCYLNHAAFAAKQLQQAPHSHEKVAVLDVDYHCGNGTASIFYDDPTVLVVSIHCHPDHEYPFHSGFEDDTGIGKGEGATKHLPLMPGTTWKEYNVALQTAMETIQAFGAQALVVSLGLDTHEGDPCAVRRAGFRQRGNDYRELGQWIGSYASELPILFIQEGGYKMEDIPQAIIAVLDGCAESRASD